MPLDPSIPLRSAVQPFDAAGAVQGAYKLRDLIESTRISQIKGQEAADKLATSRSLRDFAGTLQDPFGKDAPTLARFMARSDPNEALKFQTGAVQYGKAQSEAEKARIEAGLTQADAIARTVYGVRQLPPEQRAAAYAQSVPMLESMGLKPPSQWDEGVADQQLALAMSVKEQLEEAARQRDDARQDMTARDAMRHRGVIEQQGERRLGLTADRNAALTSQGERRLDEVTPGKVTGPILAKMARGEPLTPFERQTLEYAKPTDPFQAMIRQRMGADGAGPVPPTPVPGDAAPPPSVRARTTPPRPVSGGRPAGARVRLPDGYTPARAVSEARATIKANPAARGEVLRRLEAAGISTKGL